MSNRDGLRPPPIPSFLPSRPTPRRPPPATPRKVFNLLPEEVREERMRQHARDTIPPQFLPTAVTRALPRDLQDHIRSFRTNLGKRWLHITELIHRADGRRIRLPPSDENLRTALNYIDREVQAGNTFEQLNERFDQMESHYSQRANAS